MDMAAYATKIVCHWGCRVERIYTRKNKNLDYISLWQLNRESNLGNEAAARGMQLDVEALLAY